MEEFKTQLDKVLSMVPDEPEVSGCQYTPRACDQFTGKPSNSLIDQIRSIDFQKRRKIKGRKSPILYLRNFVVLLVVTKL